MVLIENFNVFYLQSTPVELSGVAIVDKPIHKIILKKEEININIHFGSLYTRRKT